MPAKTLFIIITPGLHIGVTAVAVWWTKNPKETTPHAELVGNWYARREEEPGSGMPKLVFFDKMVLSALIEKQETPYAGFRVFVEYMPNEMSFELAYTAKSLGYFEFVVPGDILREFYGGAPPSGIQQIKDAKALVEGIPVLPEGDYEHLYIWRAVITSVQLAKSLLVKPQPKVKAAAPQMPSAPKVPEAEGVWVQKVKALH